MRCQSEMSYGTLTTEYRNGDVGGSSYRQKCGKESETGICEDCKEYEIHAFGRVITNEG